MIYRRRLIDDDLDALMPDLPAIGIDGPKGVGKTATGLQRATTVLSLDDPVALSLVRADPARALGRPRPILIDEWQRAPEVWDHVRRAVDDGAPASSFLLTGSATPALGSTTHSGAGRIVSLRMRPMTQGRGGAAGQQETGRRSAVVHRPPDLVPHFGGPLPLVDQDRCRSTQRPGRVGTHQGQGHGIVQAQHGGGPLKAGGRLAHSLGSINPDGGELGHERIQVVIDEAPPVNHFETIPVRALKRYFSAGSNVTLRDARPEVRNSLLCRTAREAPSSR